jgi:glyoxylase I family protein
MTINRRDVISGAATIALGASAMSESKAVEKERVQGIGGLFFRSRDPKALSAWYQEHLGIDPTPTELNQPVWRQAAGETVFAPFPHDTDYFPLQQGWMVNFRVRNLDAMARQLRASGIEVKVDAQKYPNGRFARLYDPEGNPIELWEPVTKANSP